MITVALIDDHPVTRHGLEKTLSADDVEVVCSVGSVAEFRATGTDPDVVVLDLYLEGNIPSLTGVAELARRYRVLIVSMSAEGRDVLEAIMAGASGYLTKRASEEEFLEAVRVVHAGKMHMSSRLADIMSAEGRRRRLAGEESNLSLRQEELLRFLARGFDRKQAASRMGISISTVDDYLKEIRKKWGPGSLIELAWKGVQRGVVSLEPFPPEQVENRPDRERESSSSEDEASGPATPRS